MHTYVYIDNNNTKPVNAFEMYAVILFGARIPVTSRNCPINLASTSRNEWDRSIRARYSTKSIILIFNIDKVLDLFARKTALIIKIKIDLIIPKIIWHLFDKIFKMQYLILIRNIFYMINKIYIIYFDFLNFLLLNIFCSSIWIVFFIRFKIENRNEIN